MHDKKKSETHTTKDEYENFVYVHLEAAAAAECIPTKQSINLESHGRL